MDPIIRNLRKHDDWIASIGMSLAIISLFKIICVIVVF
jgi:hypothetical protein